jgi:hypothetical protein
VLLGAQQFHGWRRRCRSDEVRPFSGNEGLTSIRQDQYELQAGGHARLAKDLQRLSMERMMRASDGDAFGKVLMMGSVWWCSSIGSRMTN